MTGKIVVITSCGGKEEAERIARLLLEERLAACVSILPGVRSLYHWEGKIENAAEVVMLIKTSEDKFEAVRGAIQRANSYQVPEILALPVVAGASTYLGWLSAELDGTPQGE